MWSQALPKWISRSSRDREWMLNGESEDGELEDSEPEDGGFADGDCRLSVWPFWLWEAWYRSLPWCCTCILTWNGFLHSIHGRDICVPKCTSQPLEGFNWQQVRIPCLDSAGSESGSQTCAQSAMSMGSIWIPHLCSTGNWQPKIGNRQQVCIPYPSIQPVFHRYQSGRRIVVHSATVRRPDNAGAGAQPQEKRSRICSAVP